MLRNSADSLKRGECATLLPRRAELPLVVMATERSQSGLDELSLRVALLPFEAGLLAIVSCRVFVALADARARGGAEKRDVLWWCDAREKDDTARSEAVEVTWFQVDAGLGGCAATEWMRQRSVMVM